MPVAFTRTTPHQTGLAWGGNPTRLIVASRPATSGTGTCISCLHVLEKGAGGGAELAPALLFRPHLARSRGFGGIYLAFLSPRVRVRHWGDEGQGKVAEGVAAGVGRSEQPAAMLAAVGLARAG